MPAIQAGNNTNRVSSALVAFTPRPVLLGSQTMKQSSDNNGSSNGTLHMKLELEQKVILHQSIAQYLQCCGFSKTLKKFCSEAQIEVGCSHSPYLPNVEIAEAAALHAAYREAELKMLNLEFIKDNLQGSSVDLEEMCVKYLQTKANINIQKENQGEHEDKLVADTENASKKKKKKSDESDRGVILDQSVTAGTMKDSKNSGNETSCPGAESKATLKDKNADYKCKEKKKKKSKLASESLGDNMEGNQLEAPPVLPDVKLNNNLSDDAKTVTGAETEKKSKDKKKKKDKSSGDSLLVEKQEGLENKEKEKKDSKKRKRPTSEDNDVQLEERQVDEDPKRRKIENMNGSNLNSDKENIGKSSEPGGDKLQKTSGEQPNGKINGDIEKSGEKSSMQRSQKKQQKDSVEPKTVKAFQRVKLEQIVYADERLQDNSYWAKDGADHGYGAKAEEVLSQVRGRGFRHEKTKKKRGTYRGGQIDLQSHSIKFNYSDDD